VSPEKSVCERGERNFRHRSGATQVITNRKGRGGGLSQEGGGLSRYLVEPLRERRKSATPGPISPNTGRGRKGSGGNTFVLQVTYLIRHVERKNLPGEGTLHQGRCEAVYWEKKKTWMRSLYPSRKLRNWTHTQGRFPEGARNSSWVGKMG